MSLYKRSDSPHWWVKVGHSGRKIQHSTGTEDKSQAQEYHDKLKASLWEQQRLGVKPRRAWKEAVVRWLVETSDKATHQEDVNMLRWLDPLLGPLMLDEITLDVIDGVKAEKLKTAGKSTVNRYLGLIRAILRRARDDWEWTEKILWFMSSRLFLRNCTRTLNRVTCVVAGLAMSSVAALPLVRSTARCQEWLLSRTTAHFGERSCFPLERFVVFRPRPGSWQDIAISLTRCGGGV